MREVAGGEKRKSKTAQGREGGLLDEWHKTTLGVPGKNNSVVRMGKYKGDLLKVVLDLGSRGKSSGGQSACGGEGFLVVKWGGKGVGGTKRGTCTMFIMGNPPGGIEAMKRKFGRQGKGEWIEAEKSIRLGCKGLGWSNSFNSGKG